MKVLLDEIMFKRNLTVRQVEIMTGVSKSTIHRIICKQTSPSADTLELLAKGLNVRITELFESEYK